ncbi:MAG: helix-turn-helix transcriptional regulator [[Clostridium] aminophilum]|uniref:helix-turn-helix domain-containing protein n=1 Tax=[Clostridium] aminophilum TaxID=1526 RepID=UPI0026EB9F94|nr:helix-turn-helix transcriptional regulator [[Clostridium] aminophilum]MDD6195762.1 helix-turn-helix transcriptional regulator [[Clostridium] aminophilum]
MHYLCTTDSNQRIHADTERLKSIRKSRHLTQREVADLLHIRQQVYSKYECGKLELPIRHLVSLAKYYGVSSDRLLGLPNSRDEEMLNLPFAGDLSLREVLHGLTGLSEHDRFLVFYLLKPDECPKLSC